MNRVVRFAAVGEGLDEHGRYSRGPALREPPPGTLQGALTTIVSRLIRERFARDPQPVAWTLPRFSSVAKDLSPSGVLSNGNHLPRFLESLFHPIRIEPDPPKPLDLVILSVDTEYRNQLIRACGALRPEIAARTIPLVFEPELEVLFVQGKEALEDAYGIPRCQTNAPSSHGDLKVRLEEWRGRWAPTERLDAARKTQIAQYLKIGPGSPLENLNVWTELTERLAAILS